MAMERRSLRCGGVNDAKADEIRKLGVMASIDRVDVGKRVHRAFDAFLEVWSERGGYRFRGRIKDDDASYPGPWIWSEADVVYRFSEFLEAEFPRSWIHTEFEVSPHSRHAIEPGESAAVDLVVVDTDDFAPDSTSRVRFGQLEHHALIEAKWFQRGFWTSSSVGGRVGVHKDALKQESRLARAWCAYAAVLIVADDEQFDSAYDQATRTLKLYTEREPREGVVPDNVDVLLASPAELARRGLLREPFAIG